MQPTILPKRLYCPFESRLHPGVHIAEQHTLTWMKKFNLLSGPDQELYYRQQGFPYMVSRMFPEAPQPVLNAICDINTLLFLVDDFLDQASEVAECSSQTGNVAHKIVEVMMDTSVGHVSFEPIARALAELWDRMSELATTAWCARFQGSIIKIFKAAAWQDANIKAGKWPSVADYMSRRQYIGAANIATDLAELASNIKLPAHIYDLPVVKSVTELCRNTVCWSNDLYSWGKEQVAGEYHNLVTLIAHNREVSIPDAIKQAAELHDTQVIRFIKRCNELPDIGQDLNSELYRYVKALKYIMSGNIIWSNHETTRYFFKYENEMNVITQYEKSLISSSMITHA